MKLKAPKTWQLIMMIVSAILLAIGGSFLAVYLKTGFKPVYTPPSDIAFDDLDSVFNLTTSQYEVVNGFRLKVTTATEDVNQDEITLSFPSGIYTTKTEDGKISDGIIIVPEKVKINDIINVELVKEAYIGESGSFMINKGGISNLVFTTQNEELSSSQIQIAVDVPVVDIKVEAYNTTTDSGLGDKLTENETGKIAQLTNFILKPTFYPEASRYMFSDDKNDGVATKREKRVYYDLDLTSEGVVFKYNDGDIYFVAGDEPSANNKINAYSFATAAEQAAFDESTSQLTGLPLYTEAIRVLSTSQTAANTEMKIDIVEANVGSFSIKQTEGAAFNFAVNKLFKLSAGVSAIADEDISIAIRDVHGNDLSAMIKNVGLRVVSVKDKTSGSTMTTNLSGYVTVKGGATKTFNEKEYILINSDVKNLKHANWEISTDGEYEIVAEIKLFVQNENGETYSYDDTVDRRVYLESTESAEETVGWDDEVVSEGISMMIVYDKNGKVLSSEYKDDLRTFAIVPTGNVYQKKVFFAYYDATFPEGKDMGDYIAVATTGAGMYTISGDVNKKLYPLQGDYKLIAKEAIDLNLVFATVRTNAYGDPIMTAAGTYIIEQISTPVEVSVKKTLQGFSAVELEIDENYYFADSSYYAIPTGVENAFVLKLTLRESGDTAIFENEKSKLRFYASTESDPNKDSGVFEFGEMTLEGDVVSVPVSVRAGVNIDSKDGRGQKYFVHVEYDNSVKLSNWTAQTTGEDSQAGVMIYNQYPASIENENLSGKRFIVNQTMDTDGTSSVSIQEADGNWNSVDVDPITDLTTFNDLINGEGKIIVKDVYGREFDYSDHIIVSSNDSSIVIVDNTTHSITFGNGSTGDGKFVTVTISAGTKAFEFYVKANTTGVTEILVNGTSQDISNPKYDLLGKENEEVTLKNLLEIHVTNGQYESSAYTLKIKNMPADIKDVIKFNHNDAAAAGDDDVITDGSEVTSFKLLDNFGTDVTLSFVASNEANTLGFTFDITIHKYAYEELVAFGNVKYGEETANGQVIDIKGVADEDKGDDFDESATYVYAAFPINLNEYLKVRLGQEGAEDPSYVNWEERFAVEEGSEFILTDTNGNEIGTVTNGILTFYDVYEPTTYTFTLYSNKDGSTYAYYKEITVVVCPNFKLVQKKDLTIVGIQTDDRIENYFEIVRTTSGYGSVAALETSKLTAIDGYSLDNTDGSTSYFSVINKKVSVSRAPTFGYGEASKEIVVSVKASWDAIVDRVVSTFTANLTMGLEIDELKDYLSLFDKDNIVRYDGFDVIWFSGTGATVNADNSEIIEIDENKSVSVSLVSNSTCYRLAANSVNFATTSGDAIVAGRNTYFKVAVKITDSGTSYDIAQWHIPFVWSRVGDKVASYEYSSDAEKDILHTTNSSNYYAEVVGGQDYYLTIPFEYDIGYAGDTAYLIVLNSESRYEVEADDQYGFIQWNDEENYSLTNDNSIKISETTTVSVGQTFEIDGKSYFYKECQFGQEGSTRTLVICQVYEGNSTNNTLNAKWDGEKFVDLEDGDAALEYRFSEGIYGPMLTMLGNMKFLTGFKSSDFGENVGTVSFGTINGQKYYTITNNLLSINDIVGEEGEIFNTYFEIVQAPNGKQGVNNLTYKFYLQIVANATNEGNVTYPFNGDTENREVANGETISIDMTAEEFGADTQNEGAVRIADKINPLGELALRNADGNISANATLKIKKLSIDGTTVVDNASVERAGNGVFSVAVDGTTVSFTNGANAKNITVILMREYPNVYGADAEYSFSINSSNIEYRIDAASPSSGSTLTKHTSTTWTWKLANTDEAQTLNITTKQLSDGASSNVDKNKVVTIMTNNLGNEYKDKVRYVYNEVFPKLSITLPVFVESETTKQVYFAVNGENIATINIVIPATVNAGQTMSELTAGGSYDYAELVSLSSGVAGSTITKNSIQIVDENGNEITDDYVAIDGDAQQTISICNAMEKQTVILKFTYSYTASADATAKDGYVIFMFTINPNIAFNEKLNNQSVVAGKSFSALTFKDLQKETNVGVDNFSLSVVSMDTTLFVSIVMEGGTITVNTNYVAQTTAATAVVRISYKEGLFTADIEIPFVIYSAVKLKTNYPNPNSAENNLTYESVVSKTESETGDSNFLTGAAEFASEERFKAAAARLENGSVVYSDEYTAFSSGSTVDKVKVKEYNNMSSVMVDDVNLLDGDATNVALNSAFKFIRGNDTGVSYAVLQITYKGVTIEYTVYVFDTVVSGYTNLTTNMENGVETIYADRVSTSGLFNKNRLLQVEISSSAAIDTICYPYVATIKEDGTYDIDISQSLLQFRIDSSHIGRTINVDSGLADGVSLEEGQTILFLTEKYSSERTCTQVTGVTFKRLAGRVEYTYATADGQSIRINYNDMIIGEASASTKEDITTHTVGYLGSDGYRATISYKTTQGVDISVGRAYNAKSNSASPEIIQITAHRSEVYRLVESANIRHKSTGEYITAESMGGATLSYSVVSFGKNHELLKDGVYNYALDLNNRGYMQTNASGDYYLTLHDISDSNKKIYDYYLFGLGCAADGDYVLLKITYSIVVDEKTTLEDFYVAIQIVPDYTVTLGGVTMVTGDQTDGGLVEGGLVSNKDNPYMFTPVVTKDTDGKITDYEPMLLASSGEAGEQLISAVRTNWNSTNIAYSFDYKITESSDGEYNNSSVMNKLRLKDSGCWKETSTDPKTYVPNPEGTTTIKILPDEVVFGTKQYYVEIKDDYDYRIEFYFNLVPADDQTPSVYEAASTLNFTEDESFDIGLVYDAISINEVEEPEMDNGDIKTDEAGNTIMKTVGYQAEIQYNQTPDSNSVKKIILQNIDAWGLTTQLPKAATLKEDDDDKTFTVEGLGDYAEAPKFQDVTVTGVTFKYEDDKGTSSEGGKVAAKQINIGGTRYDIGSNISLGDNMYQSSKLDDEKIQLKTTITGTITSTTTETKDDKGNVTETTTTYSWSVTLYTEDKTKCKIDGTADATNNKIKFGEEYYGQGDTILEINNKDTNGATNGATKYVIKELNVEEGILVIEGTYISGKEDIDSENTIYYWYLKNSVEGKTTFSLVDKEDGVTLATDALFWPYANGKYRTLQAGYYTVPIMDGWIYGTSETTTVSIIINLQYGTGDAAESCVVIYNANITKKAKFSTAKKVVTDGAEFTLSEYISVKSNGLTNDDKPTFYDDTLAVTVPQAGFAMIGVSIKDASTTTVTWKSSIQTVSNSTGTSNRTTYLSLSELYGKTIDPVNNTINISWYGSDGASVYYAGEAVAMTGEGSISISETDYKYRVIETISGTGDGTKTYKLVEFAGNNVELYAGSAIQVGDAVTTVGFSSGALTLKIGESDPVSGTSLSDNYKLTQELTIKPIEKDTLWIESSERLPRLDGYGVYQYNITKSYIIMANGTFYQYKHNYTMTPKYAYLNDGLGQNVTKELNGSWVKGDDGYEVLFSTWAGETDTCDAVKVASAVGSGSNQPIAGDYRSLESLLGDELKALKFTVGVEGEGTSEARIDESGNITTGPSYEIDSEHPRYILITIYVKASGGPTGGYAEEGAYANDSTGTMKKLGELRIYLTESES